MPAEPPSVVAAAALRTEAGAEPQTQTYEAGEVLAIARGPETGMIPAEEAYSTRVAGIHSGAGLVVAGVSTCKVTAENGAIEAGDLLVASSLRGHAMKATDRSRLPGALVGKALEPLAAGAGLIRVLVTLQ